MSELSYPQREDTSPSQATVTVTNLRLTVSESVDIKETGVRNIPGGTEATRWQSIGCDPLKRRRSLLQRASTHQRLCRMVWALGMAACRSRQAVRPRGRRQCWGPGPSLRVLKAGCVSNELMFHTKYALATLSWTEMRASLRVCAQHSLQCSAKWFHEREERTSLQRRYFRVLRWSS